MWWWLTASDLPSTIGFIVALATAAGSIGAAFILVKAGSARQNLTLDQTAFARAQLMQDTLERENNALREAKESKERECEAVTNERDMLRNVVTSRALILNGFEAQGVSYERLTAPRPADAS